MIVHDARRADARRGQVGSLFRSMRRGCRRVSSAAASLAALCLALAPAALAGGAPPPLDVGATVAAFELETPSQPEFVLRGTLPVPPRTWPREDGKLPFVVIDGAGERVVAQVETVTRYPDPADGADVVELLAVVRAHSGFTPGSRTRYQVVYEPQDVPGFPGDGEVDALLATPGALRVRTRDVFGNPYQADLYRDVLVGDPSVRPLRQGHVASGLATHSILSPTPSVEGPQGTYPHLMGLHAYVTRWANRPWLTLDLRVHNALSGKNPVHANDDAMVELYFRELELELPEGWVLLNAFEDPYFGAPYDHDGMRVWPFVAPLDEGRLHLMPRMSQFHRRFAIARVGHEQAALAQLREEGLGFCRATEAPGGHPLWSWWHADTGRYFPQRQRLPEIPGVNPAALRASDASHLAAREAQVATGSTGLYPTESPGLGWAHPWGVTDGGAVGGDEIWLFDGVTTAWAASRAGYRFHQLRHRMYADRQTNVLFDAGGLPTSPESWTVHAPAGSYLPVWWYNEPMLWATDPFGFHLAPTFHSEAVASLGLQPPYEGALLGYGLIDEAHLVRYTHDAKALVWLGNDALSKDDLLAQAEGIRFAYNDLPQDLWGGVIPSGLLAAQQHVADHPGAGLSYGRGEAWGLDTMSAVYSFQTPEWRDRTRPWFEAVAQVISDGQSTCTGIIQATQLYNVFEGQYRCRQSIESAITENALVSMRESVFRGRDPARAQQVDDVVARSVYSMFSEGVWNPEAHGPRTLVAVAPADESQPPFCTYAIPEQGAYAGTDHYQIWSSFAYAFQVTGDPLFLDRAVEASGTGSTHGLVLNELENLPNRVALIALIQGLEAGL